MPRCNVKCLETRQTHEFIGMPVVQVETALRVSLSLAPTASGTPSGCSYRWLWWLCLEVVYLWSRWAAWLGSSPSLDQQTWRPSMARSFLLTGEPFVHLSLAFLLILKVSPDIFLRAPLQTNPKGVLQLSIMPENFTSIWK